MPTAPASVRTTTSAGSADGAVASDAASMSVGGRVGFGVPVNRVKRLLQMHGLDSRLPIELLVPGALIANPANVVFCDESRITHHTSRHRSRIVPDTTDM